MEMRMMQLYKLAIFLLSILLTFTDWAHGCSTHGDHQHHNETTTATSARYEGYVRSEVRLHQQAVLDGFLGVSWHHSSVFSLVTSHSYCNIRNNNKNSAESLLFSIKIPQRLKA
jgi:hypothetical protein